jgi:hypothetical protein
MKTLIVAVGMALAANMGFAQAVELDETAVPAYKPAPYGPLGPYDGPVPWPCCLQQSDEDPIEPPGHWED